MIRIRLFPRIGRLSERKREREIFEVGTEFESEYLPKKKRLETPVLSSVDASR